MQNKIDDKVMKNETRNQTNVKQPATTGKTKSRKTFVAIFLIAERPLLESPPSYLSPPIKGDRYKRGMSLQIAPHGKDAVCGS